MKIAIISCAFAPIPPHGIGAVEKLWFDLGKEFVKRGHQVTFYSKSVSGVDVGENKDGINVVYIKGYDRTKNRYTDMYGDVLYSIDALRKMAQTDIVVLNTVTSPILSRFFKSRFKVSVYNVQRYPRGQFKYYTHLDRLAACSNMIKNAVQEQTTQVKNILKTINNPVNIDAFKPIEVSKNALKTIVFTGRIHPEKGLLNLVKAVNWLNQEIPVRIVLVGTAEISKGGGGDAYVSELKKAAETVELTFVDAISDPYQLARVINQSDLYCYPPLPTTGDAMPCAPLEAMATGTPVVLSNLPCFDDYAKDNYNCLMFDVHTSPVENLYKVLKKLLENKNLCEKIAANGVKTAMEFTNEKIADKFLSDFEQLLSKKK